MDAAAKAPNDPAQHPAARRGLGRPLAPGAENRDGNEITLKTGVRSTAIEYDENHALICHTLLGENAIPIRGQDGYASFVKQYDRWGNVTAVMYFGADSRPVLHEKLGMAKITWAHDVATRSKHPTSAPMATRLALKATST